VDLDPELQKTERTIETQLVDISQAGAIGDAFVLGLQSSGSTYHLFRRKDEFEFDFDQDATLDKIAAALKVCFTTHNDDTGDQVSSTSYFPIEPAFDRAVDALPPAGIVWHLLVKKTGTGADATYQLYSDLGAGEAADPETICMALDCAETTRPSIIIKCFFRGCYQLED
jgi:hypothetical protein